MHIALHHILLRCTIGAYMAGLRKTWSISTLCVDASKRRWQLPVPRQLASTQFPRDRRAAYGGSSTAFRSLARRKRRRSHGNEAETREGGSADVSRLREITNFGTNPGNLRMRAYVPNSVPRMPSLVVALHGCTQTADEFDHGTGGPRSPMASGSLSSIPSSSLQIIPRAASLGFCQVTPLVTAAKPCRSVR